ncbi:MAG: hypothetical protein ABI416_00910 [Ginsengibacter sp.]
MFIYIAFFILVVRLTMWIIGRIKWRAFKLNFFKKRLANINGLLTGNFINSRILFATAFNALANVGLIRNIDNSKAFALITEKYKDQVTDVYQFNSFDYSENAMLFYVTVFVLSSKRIIEIGYDYVEILYTGSDSNWANSLLTDLAEFRMTERTKIIGFANAGAMN